MVPSVAAPDGEAGTGKGRKASRALDARGVRVRHARQGIDVSGEVAADVGQVLDLAALDGVGLLRALDFNQRRGTHNDQLGLDASHLELDIKVRGLPDGEL